MFGGLIELMEYGQLHLCSQISHGHADTGVGGGDLAEEDCSKVNPQALSLE